VVAVDVRHLLGIGTDGFGGDGHYEQCHQSVGRHPVIGVERTIHLYLYLLLMSEGGCLLASQFEAHQLREKVELEHPFHQCNSYYTLQVLSQAQSSS
jgi:hypothetical protein